MFHEPKKDCYYLDEDQKEQYNGYIFIRESESHVGSQFEYSLDELFCSTINVVTIDIQYSEDKTLIDDKESSLMEVDVNVPVRISHEETLYIIEKMRDYTKEENMQVDNLRQLTDKIAHNKGSKRKLFETITKDLNKEFGVSHEAEKIQRKWNGLCDSYKKCKDINRQTGRGPQKFHYYTQMDSFMSERHDVVPVCTATANGNCIFTSRNFICYTIFSRTSLTNSRTM